MSAPCPKKIDSPSPELAIARFYILGVLGWTEKDVRFTVRVKDLCLGIKTGRCTGLYCG